MPNLISILIISCIVLVMVVIGFAILDKLLKGTPAKKTEKPALEKDAKSEPPVVEKNIVTNTATSPKLKIYNSELADDLNKIIKESSQTSSSRLQIENHINKETNIIKYVQNKKYQSFDFSDDTTKENETDDQPLTFSREDYKRFMALSNIEDKKPL